MEYRELGTSGLSVSAIGLGCMGMSQSYGTPDDAESIRAIHRSLDLGVNLLDTADQYGRGANEKLVGQAIRDRRHEVVLASKFGLVPAAGGGPATNVDARPERVRTCCEASLQRLGLDVIDLYYLHRIDPNVPVEDTVGAMADLVREGKVRFLGLSEAGPQTMRRAQQIHPIAALQSEYSLWTRSLEEAVVPACRELGIGVVAFSPLGRGFFGHAIRDVAQLEGNDVRKKMPRFEGANLQKNLALYNRLEELAELKRCTTAQLAIAWLLAKGKDIIPIPGTKRQRYVEENAAAAEITLNEFEMATLDRAFPIDIAAGLRYPEESMRLIET